MPASPALTDTAGGEPAEGLLAPRAAQGFAALAIAGLAVVLMALVPLATRAAPMVKGWWVEPRTWPLVCLSLVLVAAGWQAVSWARGLAAARPRGDWFRTSLGAFGDLGAAFEYAAYFVAYVLAVSWFGFALSSLVFLQGMIWRAGLRTWGWRLIALAFVAGLVLVLRVGMGVWFPLAPVFEAAPGWFVTSVAIYL